MQVEVSHGGSVCLTKTTDSCVPKDKFGQLRNEADSAEGSTKQVMMYIHTYIHTYIHMYIYVCVCVCMCAK